MINKGKVIRVIPDDSIIRVRKATGAGFFDSKKALSEADGDEAKAIEYLMTHNGARSI